MTEPLTRLRVVVHGRVQGVGFRWFVAERAQELSLAGWVRNRPDGAVELEAEGRADAVARLASDVRRGPSLARVDRVEEQALTPKGGSGFEVV